MRINCILLTTQDVAPLTSSVHTSSFKVPILVIVVNYQFEIDVKFDVLGILIRVVLPVVAPRRVTTPSVLHYQNRKLFTIGSLFHEATPPELALNNCKRPTNYVHGRL